MLPSWNVEVALTRMIYALVPKKLPSIMLSMPLLISAYVETKSPATDSIYSPASLYLPIELIEYVTPIWFVLSFGKYVRLSKANKLKLPFDGIAGFKLKSASIPVKTLEITIGATWFLFELFS